MHWVKSLSNYLSDEPSNEFECLPDHKKLVSLTWHVPALKPEAPHLALNWRKQAPPGEVNLFLYM